LKGSFKSANISTLKNIKLGAEMAHKIFSDTSASVTELKKNPMDTVAAGDGFPVAILNRNEPVFYCIPAKAYEALMERLEDLELNAIAEARKGQKTIRVSLDEL
jgi:antitoxin StbD